MSNSEPSADPVSNGPMAQFSALLAARDFAAAADLIQVLPTDKGQSANRLLTTAMDDGGFEAAEGVIYHFVSTGYLPSALEKFVRRLHDERGLEGIRQFVDRLHSAKIQISQSLVSATLDSLDPANWDVLFELLWPAPFDWRTGSVLVRTLSKRGSPDLAMGIVRQMVDRGVATPIDTLRSVVNALVREGQLDQAAAWIDELAQRGVTDLPGGNLISVLVASGQGDKAEMILHALIKTGRDLLDYHFQPLLRFYRQRADWDGERRVLGLLSSTGTDVKGADRGATSAVEAEATDIRIRARVGDGEVPSEREFTLAVRAWSRAGNPANAERLFELMLSHHYPPSAESYGNMMAGWRHARQPERVKQWFDHMQARGLRPTERHTSVLLHSYREAGFEDKANALASQLQAEGIAVSRRSPLHSHLEELASHGVTPGRNELLRVVRGYASNADPESAEEVVEWMNSLGTETGAEGWDALFLAWTATNRAEQMADVLRRKSEDGCQPSEQQLKALSMRRQGLGHSVSVEALREEFSALGSDAAKELRMRLDSALDDPSPSGPAIDQALGLAIRSGDLARASALLAKATARTIRPSTLALRQLLVGARAAEMVDLAIEVLAFMDSMSIEADDYDVNEVLRALATAGRSADAQRVYDDIQSRGFHPNGFHLQSLLRAHAVAGDHEGVLQRFTAAVASGIPRTRHHFGMAINAAASLRRADVGAALLEEMLATDIAPSGIDVDKVLSAFPVQRAADMAAVLNRLVDANVPIDHGHIGRVMRAWRVLGDQQNVQESFDSLYSLGLRPNAYLFSELIGGYLDLGRADEAWLLFQRSVEEQAIDESLTSMFVEGTARLHRIDLAEKGIADALTLKIEPDMTSMAALSAVRRRMGQPDDDAGLRRSLEHAALTLSPSNLIDLGKRLARAGATAELLSLRAYITDDQVELDLAAKQVAAYAFVDEGAACEVAYWKIAPRIGELSPLSLQQVVAALCRARRPEPALHAFRELMAVSSPNSRAVGAVMDLVTPLVSPAEIEAILRQAQAKTPMSPREHGILFNLALRAFGRAQLSDDVLRLRDEMVERGLPIDRFTLAPMLRAMGDIEILGAEDRRLRGAESGVWEELGVLLDDVVHELTGPAVRIGGVAKRVRARALALKDEDLTAAVTQLLTAVETIIDRLSEYAILAQADAEEAEFDVRDVLRWVVARTCSQASAAGVGIQWSADEQHSKDESFRLRGQAVFFRIAVKALVSNAIEALASSDTPAGQRTVWLSTMHTSAYPSGGWIDLYIRDNGPGIPPETRERVFERGFTTKHERGLGLGLTLVESVVQLFGGTVTLSDSTSGAEFFLRFPATRPHALTEEF